MIIIIFILFWNKWWPIDCWTTDNDDDDHVAAAADDEDDVAIVGASERETRAHVDRSPRWRCRMMDEDRTMWSN